MPSQSHAEEPSKAALCSPDIGQDLFLAAAAPLSTACIGKQKTKEAAHGIRPGTFLREPSENLKSNSSDYIGKIHYNKIQQKQNKTHNNKIDKQKSDEWHEEGKGQEANIKNQFKLLINSNNSEFKQYEKLEGIIKITKKTLHTLKKIQ